MPQQLLVHNVKVVGTGSYVPERIVTNSELASMVPTSDKWIKENLGISERRVALPGQKTSDLAIEAGRKAIESANISPEQLDLIILATATPDRQAPATAPKIQSAIGANRAAAFDLNAVCSGFIYALTVGSQFIAAGNATNILVIGADTFSKITNWSDRNCVFFGDGAGAVILSKADSKSLLCAKLFADGAGYESFTVPAGGTEEPASFDTVRSNKHFFRMNGRSVYNAATRVIPEALSEVLQMAGLSVDDIDHVIPHQPSISILKESARRIGISFDKFATNMDRYANTSSATIPLLLDELVKNKRIHSNDICALVAVGAGWTWGAALIKW